MNSVFIMYVIICVYIACVTLWHLIVFIMNLSVWV